MTDPVGTQGPSERAGPGQPVGDRHPVLQATGISKAYGHVVALLDVDIEVYAGEVLAIIGDNGAGKSTLIKCLSGAEVPDAGEILVNGERVRFKEPQDARRAGIETVYQTLAVSPALDIATNMYLGREIRRSGLLGRLFRILDRPEMRRRAEEQLSGLGIATLQDITQAVETLSGGQRQAVAVGRAAAFGSKVVILDEPTAALGVRESGQLLDIIRRLRDSGLPVLLISHDMQQVFEIADRVQIQRLGRRIAVVTPSTHTPSEAVAIMTGAQAA